MQSRKECSFYPEIILGQIGEAPRPETWRRWGPIHGGFRVDSPIC